MCQIEYDSLRTCIFKVSVYSVKRTQQRHRSKGDGKSKRERDRQPASYTSWCCCDAVSINDVRLVTLYALMLYQFHAASYHFILIHIIGMKIHWISATVLCNRFLVLNVLSHRLLRGFGWKGAQIEYKTLCSSPFVFFAVVAFFLSTFIQHAFGFISFGHTQ